MPSITDVKAHLSFIFKFQLSFIKFPFLILPYTTKRHTLVRLNLQFLSKRLQFIFESIVKTPSSQPSFMSQSAIHKWSLLSRATHIKLSCFLKIATNSSYYALSSYLQGKALIKNHGV